jgi:hypothetical protein
MRCLVLVKFLPGGSLPPAEFFRHLKATWSYVKETNDQVKVTGNTAITPAASPPKAGICITDYDSIEQLTLDLAIMPGAGISNIELIPISGQEEFQSIFPESGQR